MKLTVLSIRYCKVIKETSKDEISQPLNGPQETILVAGADEAGAIASLRTEVGSKIEILSIASVATGVVYNK